MTLGNSFGDVTLWMTGNDAAEHKGVEEFKWERKRGLSWDKMSKGEGSGQIKYVLVFLWVDELSKICLQDRRLLVTTLHSLIKCFVFRCANTEHTWFMRRVLVSICTPTWHCEHGANSKAYSYCLTSQTFLCVQFQFFILLAMLQQLFFFFRRKTKLLFLNYFSCLMIGVSYYIHRSYTCNCIYFAWKYQLLH